MKLAKALVVAWTRLYSAGLPDEMRQRRSAEIESDLWEFEHDPNRPRFAAAHLLLRLLGGIWHDLIWRIEQRAPYVVAQRVSLSGTPRHPAVVTSAFTCSLTVHLVAGAAVSWLLAFPFHQRSMMVDLGAESAPVPAPQFSGSGDDQTAAAGAEPSQTNGLLAKLLENSYPLAVRDGHLSGEGAPVLTAAIAESRFVLLGETHGDAQTPEFFGAVCSAAAPMGFRTLAVEEGPLTAAKLEAWAKQAGGLTELRAFATRSPDTIHLHGRREDFEMLQQCARAGGDDFHLWGLIEEGIFRTPPSGNAEARRREQVMKDVFAANYEKAASTAAAAPKILLKFGAFHVYRGINPLGGKGIGNYVAGLAGAHRAESLHIRMTPVNRATQYLRPLLLPSDWTMFDLRPLRNDLTAPGAMIHPDLETLVSGYDILVIVP
jgi:hypothetical protein